MAYIDNKRDISNSLKISRTSTIIKYICKNIDNNQEVKRLCRYITTDPIADFALDYDNKVVQQPDLKDSLLSTVKRDKVSNGCNDRIMYTTIFTDKVMETLHPLIYVYCDQVSFFNERGGTKTIGTMLFYVDIIYDINTEELADFQHRSWIIGQQIMQMFDGVTIIEPEYVDKVGNISFKGGEQPIINKKLSPNTSLGILSIPLYAYVTGGVR